VLVEFRDATGYLGWKCGNMNVRKGWDKLDTYHAMEELGQCHGLYLQEGKLHEIELGGCNLVGLLPSSLAKLDTLVELHLYRNNLHSALPEHIGFPACLPSLQTLRLSHNPQLGGEISAEFLLNCKDCDTSHCHWSMRLPFLAGASLSGADAFAVFQLGPKAAVGVHRVQGQVAEIDHSHPDYASYTAHLSPAIGSRTVVWRLWQYRWLKDLRRLRSGYLFIFVTEDSTDQYGNVVRGSFKSKFEERKFVDGAQVAAASSAPPAEPPAPTATSPKPPPKPVHLKLRASTSVDSAAPGMVPPKPPPKPLHLSPTPAHLKLTTSTSVDSAAHTNDSKSEGFWRSAEEWCAARHFDPTLGFSDLGWGFAPGTRATNILDFERQHLAAVSKKHGFLTVFIGIVHDHKAGSSAQQVPRPSWYPYDGIEAPLGVFSFSKSEGRLVLDEGV
jgi:hypothetical protein